MGRKSLGGIHVLGDPSPSCRLSSSLLAAQGCEGGSTVRPSCRAHGLCLQRSHSPALIPDPFTKARVLWPGSMVGCRRGVLGRACGCSSPHSCVGIATERAEGKEGRGSLGASGNGDTAAPQ